MTAVCLWHVLRCGMQGYIEFCVKCIGEFDRAIQFSVFLGHFRGGIASTARSYNEDPLEENQNYWRIECLCEFDTDILQGGRGSDGN